MSQSKGVCTYFFMCALLLTATIAWECICARSADLCLVLPAPSQIIATVMTRFDRLWFHAQSTLFEMLVSLCIAISISLPLVWLMVRLQSLGSLIQLFFILFQSLPAFCLAPLLVLWFGWSQITIILPATLMVLFPLTLNMYKAVTTTPRECLEYFSLQRASSWDIFIKLQLPFALPALFAGLRISLAVLGMAAIAGEWAGASYGLGVLMVESRQSLDIEMTFAALLTVVFITLTFYGAGLLLEKKCWQLYRGSLLVIEKIQLGAGISMTTGRKVFKRAFVIQGYFLLFSLSLFCTVFMCTACGRQEPLVERKHPDKPVRLVLDWLPNPNHVPLFVGKKQGFFQEEGLDIQLVKAASIDPLQLVALGQEDLALSYLPRTLCFYDRGAKVKVIGKLIQVPLDCLMVLEESTIYSLQDLNGRVIGLSDAHLTSSFLNAFLKEAGVEPARKQNVGFDLTTSLLTKSVDAIYGAYWNIESEQIASLGRTVRYFTVEDFGIPTYAELVVVAPSLSLQTENHVAERFQRALQKSINFCVSAPDEAFQLYALENPDKSTKVLEWEKRAWKKTLPVLARSQPFSRAQTQALCDWLYGHNVVKNKIDVSLAIETLENSGGCTKP